MHSEQEDRVDDNLREVLSQERHSTDDSRETDVPIAHCLVVRDAETIKLII